MKKVSLPAPPQPSFVTKASSFDDAASRDFRANSPHFASTREAAARRDADFLGRTFLGGLWLGTLMAMSAAAVFNSGIGLSLGVGVALSLALLKSQEVVVKRATQHLNDAKIRREYSQMKLADKIVASAPLLLIGLGKYAMVGALIALAFRQSWFSTVAFVFGFALLHLVLMARAAGVLLAARVRPVAEVYARKTRGAAPDISSTHG